VTVKTCPNCGGELFTSMKDVRDLIEVERCERCEYEREVGYWPNDQSLWGGAVPPLEGGGGLREP
jgi:DNA-directed RNA polymerase subunit M/transcription elongation factor TFIIS